MYLHKISFLSILAKRVAALMCNNKTQCIVDYSVLKMNMVCY